ncbi:TPA: hypothetical protein DF272_06715 [Candidatus Falkowbacteria bacterium]|nr:hypothetical protein [Candidatus Falkowbacteria bacterium]
MFVGFILFKTISGECSILGYLGIFVNDKLHMSMCMCVVLALGAVDYCPKSDTDVVTLIKKIAGHLPS